MQPNIILTSYPRNRLRALVEKDGQSFIVDLWCDGEYPTYENVCAAVSETFDVDKTEYLYDEPYRERMRKDIAAMLGDNVQASIW